MTTANENYAQFSNLRAVESRAMNRCQGVVVKNPVVLESEKLSSNQHVNFLMFYSQLFSFYPHGILQNLTDLVSFKISEIDNKKFHQKFPAKSVSL